MPPKITNGVNGKSQHGPNGVTGKLRELPVHSKSGRLSRMSTMDYDLFRQQHAEFMDRTELATQRKAAMEREIDGLLHRLRLQHGTTSEGLRELARSLEGHSQNMLSAAILLEREERKKCR